MFQFSDGRIFTTSIQEFDGQKAYARTEIRSGSNSKISAEFSAIQNGFLKNLGLIEYTNNSPASTTRTVQDGGVPGTLAQGSNVSYAWDQVLIETTTTKPLGRKLKGVDTVTFLGLETLNLAGKTFTGVCKLKYEIVARDANTPTAAPVKVAQFVWYAKGLGWVKYQGLKADGVTPDPQSQGVLSVFLN